jgi:hypothetical protein
MTGALSSSGNCRLSLEHLKSSAETTAAARSFQIGGREMCLRPPAWLRLPDGSYERLADNDALYCGEIEARSDGELIALCDHHRGTYWLRANGGDDMLSKALEALDLHSLGMYDDDRLTKALEALESGIQTEESNTQQRASCPHHHNLS